MKKYTYDINELKSAVQRKMHVAYYVTITVEALDSTYKQPDIATVFSVQMYTEVRRIWNVHRHRDRLFVFPNNRLFMMKLRRHCAKVGINHSLVITWLEPFHHHTSVSYTNTRYY